MRQGPKEDVQKDLIAAQKKLLALQPDRDALERDLSEYRNESEEVRALKSKIAKLKGVTRTFFPLGQIQAQKSRYKLKRALKPPIMDRCTTVHACVVYACGDWDETNPMHHQKNTRVRMLESIAKSVEPLSGMHADDVTLQKAPETSETAWKIRELVVEGANNFTKHEATEAVIILNIAFAALLAGVEVGLDVNEPVPTWMRAGEWFIIIGIHLEVVIKTVAEEISPGTIFGGG